MKKLDLLNKNNFHKHAERKFDKNIIVGHWFVWKNHSIWREFIFEISGRFVEIKQGKETVGNWLYLPDLQIINISFRDDKFASLNFYIWYDAENGSLIFREYEEYPAYLKRFFLLRKNVLPHHHQQKTNRNDLYTFVESYQMDIKVQNEIEDNIINQQLGIGCSIFGLLMLLSLVWNYGSVVAWFVLGIIYLFWGAKRVKKQLLNARQKNYFEPKEVLGLLAVDTKVHNYDKKKFIYGLIGFVVMAFIILNII